MIASHGDGPIPARIMLVGEAWGEQEERERTPFVGASGQELNRMLAEAGLMRSECYVTNLVNARPPGNDLSKWIAQSKKAVTPEHAALRDKMVLPIVAEGYESLLAEIRMVQPNLIVAFGNWALWALTGHWGILKWRGSQLSSEAGAKVIPTIHPASVLREWSQRALVVNDLRRAARELGSRDYSPPDWHFRIRPAFGEVLGVLGALWDRLETGERLWLDLDLETAAGHIDCCGLSWSLLDAICIPFMENGQSYWTEDEETQIVYKLYRLLTHACVAVRWQNGLYDAQYIHRRWLFVPRGTQDTMISQHAIFSDLPKALHFQASMYAKWYVYWKDEGKSRGKNVSEDQHWRYNCQDCIYTREVGEVELQVAEKLGLLPVHAAQQAMFAPVLRAMLRGVRVLEGNAARLAAEIRSQISLRRKFLRDVLGYELNTGSSKQMKELFYEDLRQPVVMTRAARGTPAHPTCNDAALQLIASRNPLLAPLTNCIADLRTLGKFLAEFVLAKRDTDGRMRCSFNIGGSESGESAPKTYRLSSSKNPFGSGMNLQTIPSEKSKSIGKWEARQHFQMIGNPYSLPNLRSMFGPDEDFTFFDMDLDRADLHVFVWEIDDELYKDFLRRRIDAHLFHVYLLDGKEPPPLDELVETHPRYWDHRGPRKHQREFAKVFCHATDYVGSPRTLAIATGRTVREVETARKRYLGAHPKIESYWKDLEARLQKDRFVQNAFGYRWYVFDRLDSVLPEAVAWIPQSTVSLVINQMWRNLDTSHPEIEVLLQVHDSLAGQFPTARTDECLAALRSSAAPVPYADPLTIPTGLHTSEISWGAC